MSDSVSSFCGSIFGLPLPSYKSTCVLVDGIPFDPAFSGESSDDSDMDVDDTKMDVDLPLTPLVEGVVSAEVVVDVGNAPSTPPPSGSGLPPASSESTLLRTDFRSPLRFFTSLFVLL